MNSKVFNFGEIAESILLGSAGQAYAPDNLISALGGKVFYDATTNFGWIADAIERSFFNNEETT